MNQTFVFWARIAITIIVISTITYYGIKEFKKENTK